MEFKVEYVGTSSCYREYPKDALDTITLVVDFLRFTDIATGIEMDWCHLDNRQHLLDVISTFKIPMLISIYGVTTCQVDTVYLTTTATNGISRDELYVLITSPQQNYQAMFQVTHCIVKSTDLTLNDVVF